MGQLSDKLTVGHVATLEHVMEHKTRDFSKEGYTPKHKTGSLYEIQNK